MTYFWEVIKILWFGSVFALMVVIPLSSLFHWIMTNQYLYPKENVGLGMSVGLMLLVISFFVAMLFDNGD